MKPQALLVAAVLAVPSLSAADPFGEYRVPAHAWGSGSGRFSLSAWRANESFERYGEDARSSQGSGSLGGEWQRGWDSDGLQWGGRVVGSLASFASHRDEESGAPAGYRTTQDERDQANRQQLALLPQVRFYPGESAFGVDLAAQLLGSWEQDWSRSDVLQVNDAPPGSEGRTRYSLQRHANDYSARVTAAAGVGRVRDASVVEDAHRIEERLREAGALWRRLSPAAREKLARLLSVTPEISHAHERPERYRWREIERVLAEDGALPPAGLDAYDAHRIAEIDPARLTRRRGFFVGATATFDHRNSIRRYDRQDGSRYVSGGLVQWDDRSTVSDRQAYSSDDVRAGVLAEWHRPAGWAWQWDAWASANAPVRPGEHGLATDLSLAGAWHVSDRWLAIATLRQARDYVEAGGPHGSRPRDAWQVAARATLNWFVEDRTAISLELSDSQGRSRYGSPAPAASAYLHEMRLSVGVSYRFLGRFEAPGLVEPMSLLR